MQVLLGFRERPGISQLDRARLGGGTAYAPAMEAAMKQWNSSGDPGLVCVITDGNCDDRAATERLVCSASEAAIFWQFIGVGNESFDFLRKLDDLPVPTKRRIDNAGFTPVRSLSDLTFASLLNEFPSYLQKARAAGIVH